MRTGWFIFDWTDGCLAHPFMDLGVLPTGDESVRTARLQAFLAVWQDRTPALAPVLEAALPVAAGFHAVSYQRIVDNVASHAAAEWSPVVGSFLDRMFELLTQET